MAVLDFHFEFFIVAVGQITTDAADEVVMLERFWLAHGRCLPRQAMPWLLAISRTKIVFQISGAHAAAFSLLIRASHRLDVWLGDGAESEDSFPLSRTGDTSPRTGCFGPHSRPDRACHHT